jgi:hypothetical protein
MKYFFFFLSLLLGFSLSAQPKKGSLMLNGKLEFKKEGNFSSKTVAPSIGYFFSSKLAVGATVGVTDENDNSGSYSSRTGFLYGVFVRKYFSVGKEERFFFFLHPYLQNVNFNYDNYSSTTTNYVVFGLSPGFTFFPARRIGIDFTFINLVIAQQIKNNGSSPAVSFEGNSAYPSLSITFLLRNKEIE